MDTSEPKWLIMKYVDRWNDTTHMPVRVNSDTEYRTGEVLPLSSLHKDQSIDSKSFDSKSTLMVVKVLSDGPSLFCQYIDDLATAEHKRTGMGSSIDEDFWNLINELFEP